MGVRQLRKIEPKCPVCGSKLVKQKRGFMCPNSKCEVIKVYFDRNYNVIRVDKQGLSSMSKFGKDFT